MTFVPLLFFFFFFRGIFVFALLPKDISLCDRTGQGVWSIVSLGN